MKKFISLLFFASLFLLACVTPRGTDVDYSEFATCLTDEGFVMYGAFWCPHCADQKKEFGDAFANLNYVECDPNGDNAQPELCLEKEIQGYPTWIHEDEVWEGFIPLETLSRLSGCELPVTE